MKEKVIKKAESAAMKLPLDKEVGKDKMKIKFMKEAVKKGKC